MADETGGPREPGERTPLAPEPPAAPESPQMPGGPGTVSPPPHHGMQDAVAPRELALRERGIGEILDAAITIYRTHWKTFMGIVAIVQVPFVFLQAILIELGAPGEGEAFGAAQAGFFGLAFILLMVQFLIVNPFLTGAITKATADVYLGGTPNLGDTYRYALSRTGTILWVTILYGLVVAGGFILLVVPGIYLAVALVFATPSVVVEARRGVDALKRSRALAKGYWWRIFGTLLLAMLLFFVAGAILGIPFGLLSLAAGPVSWLVEAIGNSIVTVITTPFFGMLVVLLYFDMRIRKEGFDLALMAQELGTGPGPGSGAPPTGPNFP